MIELKNIHKRYRQGLDGMDALRGVDLSIQDGEFIAIMGTSGSGKSTLLNIIGCMDSLSEGSYQMDGINVESLRGSKLHKFRRDHISFVFQHFALMEHYTVLQNVELPLQAKGVSRKNRREVAMEKLEMLGIQDLAGQLPNRISGGQQQRCAVARALASGNEYILADEPTGALDSKTSKEMMEIFTLLKEQGKTLVVVTHDPEVASYADRIVHLEDGRVI